MGRGTGTAAIKSKLLHHLTAMREVVLFEILLDLQNTYDALDRERYADIITVYGVISRALQILLTYWGRLTMVARARGYYGPLFKGYHGVTQGDPLPPNLVNVVV